MMVSRVSLCFNNQLLSRTCPLSQVFNKSLHISCQNSRKTLANFKYSSINKIVRYSPAFSNTFIRSINTNGAEIHNAGDAGKNFTNEFLEETTVNAASGSLIDQIPEPPLAPPTPEIDEVIVQLTNKLGEPTFESLGLGGWYPTGIIQQLLEFLHVSGDIPWWACITIGTICVRMLVFPLVIIGQKQMVHMNNNYPEMQRIQMKLTEARMCGDQLGAAKASFELMEFMKDNKCNPIKNMMVPLVQFPIFASFFFGLKRMANLPVESMQTGGLYWFKDLTVTDPYYLLPILTSATLSLTLKFGVDAPALQTMGMMKYIVQAIPIFILPFTINFSSAISWYWLSTNIFSLLQVLVLKIPAVREYFNIPVKIKHPPNAVVKKSFKQGFKDSMENMKVARELGDRTQLDAIQFNRAGRGPVQRTYKYNPLLEHIKKTKLNEKS